ncbi:MAG TPA: IclR family transcriptional regulator [Candidatus Limnocylindrales bacterium]
MYVTPRSQASGPAPVMVAPEVLDANAVRSVDRAAALLISLGEWDGEVGVTELARSLGLHKSTASRLLATLHKRGLVAQDRDSGKYRLGLAVVRLGSQAEKALDLRALALPSLQTLSRHVKETATLGTLDGDRVITIAWADGSGMSRDRTGRDLPLHATAPGKVLLSSRPEREVIRLSEIGLTPYTPYTIVRVDLLLEELARVRKRGFATAFGENEPTVNAVAVPVYDHRSTVVAALEVRASGNRIQPSRLPELLANIRDAAVVITESIGGVVAAQ